MYIEFEKRSGQRRTAETYILTERVSIRSLSRTGICSTHSRLLEDHIEKPASIGFLTPNAYHRLLSAWKDAQLFQNRYVGIYLVPVNLKGISHFTTTPIYGFP